jgi:CspA family cold shock protein
MPKDQGEVKFWNTQKGWGMISGPNGDVFAHFSNLDPAIQSKKLSRGDIVKFQTITTPRGLAAIQIHKLEDGLTEPGLYIDKTRRIIDVDEDDIEGESGNV